MHNGHGHALALTCSVAILGLVGCASAPPRAGFASENSVRSFNAWEPRAARAEVASESDELITSLIREQFARDPQVTAGAIGVDTFRGTVELSGMVDDSQEIRRAVKIALATPGVRTVRNDMRVVRP